MPGRSYGLAIARRLGVDPAILADAEARVPDAERSLDVLLASVEERRRELHAAQESVAERLTELDSLGARLSVQAEAQAVREAELKRREKEAERAGRQMAKNHLMEARQLVEQALGAARAAADDVATREARRLIEEGIREQGERIAEADRAVPAPDPGLSVEGEVGVGDQVRLETGQSAQVLEIRTDGKLVVTVGSMRMVVDAGSVARLGRGRPAERAAARTADGPAVDSSLEIDLRGMTGDEAEMATVAAVDAAVLAEQPFLRIIHGMGTGVVRERVRRVVAKDRRIARYGFAPRNQGGSGVTIVEFSA